MRFPQSDVKDKEATFIPPAGTSSAYATQLVERAVGFEGDPIAFAMVESTLRWNEGQPWHNHTRVFPVAIAAGAGAGIQTLAMKGSGASTSGLSSVPGPGHSSHPEWSAWAVQAR